MRRVNHHAKVSASRHSYVSPAFLCTDGRTPSPVVQARRSLDKMAMGGIYDQLGGGFARYATDHQWRIPHFEKMLYDNAQLISLYAGTTTPEGSLPVFEKRFDADGTLIHVCGMGQCKLPVESVDQALGQLEI